MNELIISHRFDLQFFVPFFFFIPNATQRNATQHNTRHGLGYQIHGGSRLPRRRSRLRARRAALLLPLARRRRQARPPPLLRRLLRRRSLGHLRRRHHHVQAPAPPPVRQPSGQDVPRLLRPRLCLRRRLRGCLRLPPPVGLRLPSPALPARLSPLRSCVRPLQPARLHPHDHRDDEEAAQARKGAQHRGRGRLVQERRGRQDKPLSCSHEQEVRHDTRLLFSRQHHVLWLPGHALLVPCCPNPTLNLSSLSAPPAAIYITLFSICYYSFSLIPFASFG